LEGIMRTITRSTRPAFGTAASVIVTTAAVGALVLANLLSTSAPANAAEAPVDLGAGADYSVLASSTVTSIGSTTLDGSLGLSPGTSITGFVPGMADGATHAADVQGALAKADVQRAYLDAESRSQVTPVAADLGGQTLTPGVYGSASSLGLTGTLVLDAQGDPEAVFVFKAGSTLTTASASRVELVGGASAAHVFWQVGSSATLGTGSSFTGTILALASITVTTGTQITGRALALNGAVTLDHVTVAAPVG
jgi:hypothetical protein